MKVRLFHTLPEEGRTSSEVYARELALALGALPGSPADLSHCAPRGRLRRAGRLARPLARLGGYADRYLAYQWMARGRDAEVNHIVDHGYGHLAYSLDPRRTAVAFHDAMLLKLEARELPINSYPWFTILGHRLSLGAIARVARVITPSESARRDLLRLTRCRPERVRVVPLGVSGHFRPPAAPCPDRAPGAAGRPARIL
ncbi:MAG: glycosyltransferase, partial [Acidobacteria bacterium]|nr:glycosyltransferase [Acidobacteriota bacterium]